MSPRAALPLLQGLCDEWMARGQMLSALGGSHDPLGEALTEPAGDTGEAGEAAASRAQRRRAEVAAFAAAVQ
ncbi:hypothetical protein [Micromonospora sp. NPDC050200]|uniref:hypothetical protein n=1 Tax=Micromonospora sp. NPDC050200 TaxID=3155664 RepID=UPI0033C5EB66